ncbi:hypothetical protein ACVWXQ_009906 [Bradyrhizobium sp. S3.14.4]
MRHRKLQRPLQHQERDGRDPRAAVRLVSRYGQPAAPELAKTTSGRPPIEGGPHRPEQQSGESVYVDNGERRQPSGSAADRAIPPPHHAADRHRNVFRRFRHLYRRDRAQRHAEDRLFDPRPECGFHLRDLRRHDAGIIRHRLPRRPLRTPLHLSIQFAPFRRCLPGRGVLTEHGLPDRLPLRDGRWARGGERRRLFDDDGIRARAHPWQMARLHDRVRRHRSARGAIDRVRGGAAIRLALHVRARRRRRARGVVHAQVAAGIAALAGSCGTHRRGGSADASHREGSRAGSAPASSPRPRHRSRHLPISARCSPRPCCRG